MIRLLLIIAVIVCIWWFIFYFARISGPQQQKLLSKFLLYGVAGLLLLLVITGRAHWLYALIGAALPWLQRVMVLKNAYQSFKRYVTPDAPSSGQKSTVKSSYLEMVLDHDTGALSGEVLRGSFKAQQLNDLSLDKLAQLMAQVADDGDSQNLLIAYLDNRFDQNWRQHFGDDPQRPTPSNQQMTRSEALAILGLDDAADQQMIIKAHKKLMQKLHPDRGGSEYLASKINQAKDHLIG